VNAEASVPASAESPARWPLFQRKEGAVDPDETETEWDDEPTLVVPQREIQRAIYFAFERVTLPYLPSELVDLGIAETLSEAERMAT